MSEEATAAAETADESSLKPTITIAEKQGGTAAETAEAPAAESTEDVSYQAVEKEGTVTAIWEMQGQKHLRTIDPRSNEGKQILALFETAG